MEIRYIKPEEAVDYLKVSAASFIWKFDAEVDKSVEIPVMAAFHNGKLIAGVELFDFETNYCGNFLNSLVISGVCSQPEYRRIGGVKEIFNKIEELSLETNITLGFLQPFSISYYEKFGFSYLNRMFCIKVPFENLKSIPRCNDVILYTGEQFDELSQLHNKCALTENLMTARNDKKHFCDTPLENADYTYFHRNSQGIADGYIRFTVQRPEALRIEELFVLSPEALYALIGFVRSYDGLVKHLIVKNQYQGSPFWCLCDRIPDVLFEHGGGAAGRIYNLQKLLESNKYPDEYGRFRIRCEDTIGCNNGIFEVEYEHGKAEITRKNDEKFDISVNAPAAARLMLAGEGHNFTSAQFINGVTFNNSADDFFRAFPYRRTRFTDSFWSL